MLGLRHPDNHNLANTTCCVENTETWEEEKKFTVYKVMVKSNNQSWFVFRRYNEFYKLHELLKKQVPQVQLKLPGKKLFGNNLDPRFIQSRREGLDIFIQQIMQDTRLMNLKEVRTFFQLDKRKIVEDVEECNLEQGTTEESNETENKLCLGSSERKHAKPDDFEFLKVIGKGSFGQVLLVKHKNENKYYAVKVVSKKHVLKKNEVKHIMSERNALLKTLNHPFLVGLHYSFQTNEKLYFILDYINGGELFFHLQKTHFFPEHRAQFYAAEIALAIGYLHSQGIVYRDLKPENLLLDSKGHVVLTDFGLVKEGLLLNATTNTFCGTPEYLAPEVLRKEGYGRSVDWWCLGAVLYEMVYGLPPFYSTNTALMYEHILHKPLQLRGGISDSAKDILIKLLDKDENSRLGSGIGDVKEIKSHHFFHTMDWDALYNKQIEPPFNPQVADVLDFHNIDQNYINETISTSVSNPTTGTLSASVCEADDNVFAGFSYAPPMAL